MKHHRLAVVIGMILVAGCIVSPNGESTSPETPGESDPVISAFPEDVSTESITITTTGESPVESRAAERLEAILRQEDAYNVSVVPYSELTDTQREETLITIGSLDNQSFGNISSESGVREEFQSLSSFEGKVAITKNPWNESNLHILIGGAEDYGIWKASEELARIDEPTNRINATYKPLPKNEISQLKNCSTVSNTVAEQVSMKNKYIRYGSDKIDGTYLENASPSAFIFQYGYIITEDKLNESEIETLRIRGVNNIGPYSSGEYSATIPVNEIQYVANISKVTRIETGENKYKTPYSLVSG